VPKATLEFDLPDEQPEYKAAINGAGFAAVLCELDGEMRACGKYDTAPHREGETDERYNHVQTVTRHWRDRLHALLTDEGLSIWD
jgi:hypothetical protein